MATWKKIIVSGSNAILNQLNLPALTTNRLVQVGTSGVLQDSGISIANNSASFGNINIISTGGSSVVSGSFSGSFVGSGAGLTGLPTSLNFSGSVGNDTLDLLTDDLTFAAGNSITTTATNNQIEIKVSNAGITETQLNTSVAGTGLAGGAGIALSVDLNEVGAAEVDVDADSIVIIDADGSNATKKESVADFVSAIAGTNINGTGGQLSLPPTLTGAHTFDNNLTVDGDLIVKGTTTSVQTTNLLVEDKFILLNSGSADPDEGGLIVDGGGGSGSAFVYEADSGITRWGFHNLVAHDASTVNTRAYVSAVIDENNSNHTGATSASFVRNGNIKIASNGDIFIYS
jgi:hypothetical protein